MLWVGRKLEVGVLEVLMGGFWGYINGDFYGSGALVRGGEPVGKSFSDSSLIPPGPFPALMAMLKETRRRGNE